MMHHPKDISSTDIARLVDNHLFGVTPETRLDSIDQIRRVIEKWQKYCRTGCPNPSTCEHGYCTPHQYSYCRCVTRAGLGGEIRRPTV